MLSLSYSGNLLKLPLIQAFRWFLLGLPIAVIFYQDNGINLSEVFLIQAFFSFVILVCEVPSGSFADHFSYKKSLLFGAVFIFLGNWTYVFSTEFNHFLVGVFLLGVGSSLVSGCDSALLYDSLLELKKEGEYIDYDSKMYRAAYYAEGFAGIVGGALALYSLRTPYIAQAIIFLFIFPLILSIKEPTLTQKAQKPSSMKNAIGFLFADKKLLSLCLFFAWINAAGITFVWQVQAYLKQLQWPLAYFGLTWAILQFSTGIFSNFTPKFAKSLNLKQSLFAFLAFISMGYLGLTYNYSPYGFILFFLFFFNRAMMGPISRNTINDLIPSELRATILSIKTLFMRVFFCCIGPYIGAIVDTQNSNVAFFNCFIIFGTGGLALLYFCMKHITSLHTETKL
ncbi:MAG: MFS transporter [Candidatus Cloacimonetes bacterium]|nr:MFS transporter [Candidatus Cloacimonadota bacterium]